MAPLREFAGEDAAFYQANPQAATFLWVDSFTGQFQIHPLYLEFLKTKGDMLSGEEKRGGYHWAAGWCMRSQIYSDAMEFYAKLKDYLGVQSVLLTYPLTIASGPYNYAKIDSHACLGGENAGRGDLDLFLEAARAAAPCISNTFAGLYSGYDDLVACETAFYRAQTDQAKYHAYRAIQKAGVKKQYSI